MDVFAPQCDHGFSGHCPASFGGQSDPITVSTEFKRYGWKVTGSTKKQSCRGMAADENVVVSGRKKAWWVYFRAMREIVGDVA